MPESYRVMVAIPQPDMYAMFLVEADSAEEAARDRYTSGDDGDDDGSYSETTGVVVRLFDHHGFED